MHNLCLCEGLNCLLTGIALEPQPTPRAQEPELSPLSTPPITIRRLPSSTQPTDPPKVEETAVLESRASSLHLEVRACTFLYYFTSEYYKRNLVL